MPSHKHLPGLLALALVFSSLPASAQERTAEGHYQDGVKLFFEGKPAESVAAFDRLIALDPSSAPNLWQRGLALYYAGDFKAGRKQFELHQTVNRNDVENAAWHFLCVARTDGAEEARKVLIPIKGDARVPMKEVHDLYAGKGNEQAVLTAADSAEPGEEARRNHLCYAHLYLGLYHEAIGNTDRAKEHMLKAAVDYRMDHYMGRVAQVHATLRGWLPQPSKSQD